MFSAHNLDLVSISVIKLIFIDRNHRIFEHSNPQNFNVLEQLFFDRCVSDKRISILRLDLLLVKAGGYM